MTVMIAIGEWSKDETNAHIGLMWAFVFQNHY